ncbi:protein of unknown function [Mariniphaga anaerophila]|uniref:DUF4831 domain-containing protein n=1 Tax=Mariniphaga anaerophila TaxID=1484053 RepID=A0A1M5FY00_9BACT|nr:DUF4831 family protein [Mariniphaga anaerophila]SHF96052.1 protein of unknown function [Mariniphaga anaerophila]
MRILTIVLAILLSVPVLGQRRNKGDESVVPAFQEGITYALPRTGLRIKVEAEKEMFQPGPYAAYAEQLLGITDAKNRASVKWTISKVEMATFAEPDPEQVHKAMGEAAFLVDLSADGILTGINSEVVSKELAILNVNDLTGDKKDPGFSFANINHTPMYASGDSSNSFRPIRISTDVKAAEAAERVLECRLTRYHMVAGLMDEFHPDGEAYKVSLKELERIEKNYLSLFVGKTTRDSETFSFDFVPTSATDRGEVVFRFSEDSGVLPASDLSGKPVTVRVELEKELVSKYASLAGSENPAAGESGVYYRMPAVATVSLVYELKTVATARTVMAQFGQVAPVPEELLFGAYAIEFYPETGAVKSVRKK